MTRLILAASLGLAAGVHAEPIIREDDAIYLADFDAPTMRLNVLEPAPAYFDYAGQRYVGTLRFPQSVELEAISERAYRVKGNARQGQILGWVAPRFLQTIPKETLAAFRESEERRKLVAALIAAGEVAMGMVTEEVQESIGSPQKRSTRNTEASSTELWEYVEYDLIPQYSNVVGPRGVVTVATTYVKTPVGRLSVEFTDGVVTALDQSEGTILDGTQTTIVAPPVFVY